ncbi:maleylpyruvate isomerase family mycothiol-dependent enzyme [Polymorphospora lycopeni]|uniref:Maleylpyruvate isomerase family mycothiol-dependent enzyme n=1 Tax=Polymorphospora lycopeni TaxID=3140240 RepID=A0ABV5D0A2_9ACTN
MTADPLVLMAEVRRATDRLLSTVADLSDAAVAAPSALPGWSRGHVLTHLARNADGMTNLLEWARTGVVTPQYPSWERRVADIEAGAGRPLAVQLADLRDSAARHAATADRLTSEMWLTTLEIPDRPQTAAYGVWRRLREIEVHHVDLAAGYRPRDWPEAFALHLLHEIVSGYAGRDDAPNVVLCPVETGQELSVGAAGATPTVTGPAYALAGWLTGRSTGESLEVTPDGPLPNPPNWM